jgi:hypothetical protein
MTDKGPEKASRPAAQRDRMRARNVAMPNSRLPSIYSTVNSVYTVAKAPRFITLPAPLAIPKALSTNIGAWVVNSGKIKASANEKGIWSAQKRLNRR